MSPAFIPGWPVRESDGENQSEQCHVWSAITLCHTHFLHNDKLEQNSCPVHVSRSQLSDDTMLKKHVNSEVLFLPSPQSQSLPFVVHLAADLYSQYLNNNEKAFLRAQADTDA